MYMWNKKNKQKEGRCATKPLHFTVYIKNLLKIQRSVPAKRPLDSWYVVVECRVDPVADVSYKVNKEKHSVLLKSKGF